MRSISVVGGSGFIGTRLVRRLSAQENIAISIVDKVPSLNYSSLCKFADIRNIDNILRVVSGCDVLINLAAEHRDDISPKSLYAEVNVCGARNICEVARTRGINTIIFTSSVAVYGFAPVETGECGLISPFNDYGRTKWEAENIYKEWQAELPNVRTLVIVRPTVVFGERNRGNVFNLLSQIASGRFLMVGSGLNRKSMAYVENVAAFLEYALNFKPGIHLYNYIDKPDFTMNQLVAHVTKLLGRSANNKIRIPFLLGLLVGSCYDFIALLSGKKFSISAIRVKKFCANSVYQSTVESTGFIAPVTLKEAIERTVRFEFIESNDNDQVFYSE